MPDVYAAQPSIEMTAISLAIIRSRTVQPWSQSPAIAWRSAEIMRPLLRRAKTK